MILPIVLTVPTDAALACEGLQLTAPPTTSLACEGDRCAAVVPLALQGCDGAHVVDQLVLERVQTWRPPRADRPDAEGLISLSGPRLRARPRRAAILRFEIADDGARRQLTVGAPFSVSQADDPAARAPSSRYRIALAARDGSTASVEVEVVDPRMAARLDEAGCTSLGVRADAPDTAALSCPDGDLGRCTATFSYRVRNCWWHPIDLGQVHASPRNSGFDAFSDAPRTPLQPGDARTYPFEVTAAGTYDVSPQFLVVEVPPLFSSRAATVEVTHPERDAAMARCKACNGDWGRHGIRQFEGCVCRAADAGERCTDGDDCDGYCEYERTVVTSRDPDMGYQVGRCSEFVGGFGCRDYVPSGADDRGPQPLPLARHGVCAD